MCFFHQRFRDLEYQSLVGSEDRELTTSRPQMKAVSFAEIEVLT